VLSARCRVALYLFKCQGKYNRTVFHPRAKKFHSSEGVHILHSETKVLIDWLHPRGVRCVDEESITRWRCTQRKHRNTDHGDWRAAVTEA
jgi:hypothetical protein